MHPLTQGIHCLRLIVNRTGQIALFERVGGVVHRTACAAQCVTRGVARFCTLTGEIAFQAAKLIAQGLLALCKAFGSGCAAGLLAALCLALPLPRLLALAGLLTLCLTLALPLSGLLSGLLARLLALLALLTLLSGLIELLLQIAEGLIA